MNHACEHCPFASTRRLQRVGVLVLVLVLVGMILLWMVRLAGDHSKGEKQAGEGEGGGVRC